MSYLIDTDRLPMTCEDSLIAATALHHAHTIVTRDLSHFKHADVPALDPTAL
ncbi:MAG: type II toxin-antitoxin system VapC family toxin [Verrucomicrobia bacterium]|nr:type II toxin-antitoxin system VapC family toxin [Verrucomicrobiota bacterium]